MTSRGAGNFLAAWRRIQIPLPTAFRRLPLGYQLGCLVLATAIPLLASALLMFFRLAENERESVRQDLLVHARTLAALVDNEVATYVAIGATLGQSEVLLAGDFARFGKEATRALSFVPGAWLTLTDPQGKVLFSTSSHVDASNPKFLPAGLSRRALATHQPAVSDLETTPLSSRPTAFVAVPVFDQGKPVYAITISLLPERLLVVINRYKQSQLVAILDGQYRFIARIPDHEAHLGSVAGEEWRNAIAGTRSGWIDNRSLEGEQAIAAFATTAGNWIVTIAERKNVIDTPLRGILLSSAIITLALVALGLTLAAILARHTSRGIAGLALAARQLGEGRQLSSTEAPFTEAATIAHALSEASEELARRAELLARANCDLEAQVALRTGELSTEMKLREESEQRVRQMQKMDAIGQLSGGIAHDFNNMLAIILSSLHLLERKLSRGERDVSTYIAGAREGAERAAMLTKRLLAFARTQPLNPSPVDANRLITGMSDLLRRALPENIAIETVLAGDLWRVHADANQLENALLNLATNARDAMRDGGKLTFETANIHLDTAYSIAHSDVTPGEYVLIAVTDTGGGMQLEVAEKAFEPFFTTKPTGQGTGLGLPQVYGFLKQSGGHVKICNQPGRGLAVKLYLPRYVGSAKPAPAREELDAALPRAKTHALILVVEDEPEVLKVTTGILHELGYRTLSAMAAEQALTLIASEPDIRLLLTDVVMPGMNGRVLADAALQRRPDLKVIFTTGYTRTAVVHNGIVEPNVELIVKPFTPEALARALHRTLWPEVSPHSAA